MTRYSEHAFREMAADPKWDKREPAVPTVPFDQWLTNELRDRLNDIVAELIEEGWPEDDALIAAQQYIEDGN